jgi:hypothetical protein
MGKVVRRIQGHRGRLAGGIAILLFLPSSGAWAEGPAVACTAEKVTIALGEAVLLRAWARSPEGGAPAYAWDAAIGELEARGASARWDLRGVRPGTYAATVRVTLPSRPAGECIVRVVVRQDALDRGGPGALPTPSRETGSALLVAGEPEAPGYGLYSYLLLGARPEEEARERVLKAIEAYWGLVPEISRLEQYVPRQQLNVAYLPVGTRPEPRITAAKLLESYDYARARSILRFVPGATREGPYILSALRPIGVAGDASPLERYLFQDLSRVPPHLVASWVKEFLGQAAQERFWEVRTVEGLGLKLRVTVGVLADALPEVRKALDTWIAWVR